MVEMGTVQMEWRPTRWSVCLPLLIFPCTMKSRSSLLAPAHLGGPAKRAIERLWWWFLVSYHVTSNFAQCRYYWTFKGPYFRIAWGWSYCAGSPICIVFVDMTLTRSKVKVTWRWPSALFRGLLCFSSFLKGSAKFSC